MHQRSLAIWPENPNLRLMYFFKKLQEAKSFVQSPWELKQYDGHIDQISDSMLRDNTTG